MFSAFDYEAMAEALRLAERGLTTTQPNPTVGCVITSDEQIIGRGWTQPAGQAHAEIHALQKATADVRGATAYVTLEPCSHHGRTPPCVEALINAGLQRVVIAVQDPFEQVNGRGVEVLRDAGIQTEVGLLEEPARALNAGFFSRLENGRPWVRVKLAQSLDGGTALGNGDSQWITGAEARQDGQRWRARAGAILTGIGTVLQDDPRLTVRLPEHTRQPHRIVLDTHWRTPPEAKLFQHPGEVWVLGSEAEAPSSELQKQARCIALPIDDGMLSATALMKLLTEHQINEVHVEAGAVLAGSLLRRQLIDELLLYVAPVVLGSQTRPVFAWPILESMQQRVHFRWLDQRQIGNDLRYRLRPVYPPETSE